MNITLPMNSSGAPGPNSGLPWRERLVTFAIKRRVHISLLVFIALIAEDVLEGLRPHNLTNLYDPKALIGVVLVVAGLALRSWAAGMLRKSAEVTTTGPYSVVRHPLYVGSFMMMIGFCTLIDDAENIWFVLGPFALLYALAVFSEERKLAARFGARWNDYAQAVPRFFPRRWPINPFASWNLQQWLGNREYQAIAACGVGLIAMKIWQLS